MIIVFLILCICLQDVGDGWWEARNYLGNVGLIPEAYVEVRQCAQSLYATPKFLFFLLHCSCGKKMVDILSYSVDRGVLSDKYLKLM